MGWRDYAADTYVRRPTRIPQNGETKPKKMKLKMRMCGLAEKNIQLG
jgi:hypothetical protein